ncbi:MAG: mitomycin resistance protein [Acidobacteria bacterium]|nr:MAG: mitomycin resistance protein [Acidobacteriota bacterium]PYU49645.1 MAG: mitomycin resistance protein [Acidobacteriota bacterium]PYU58011.1 MAG: mitomycin resistance protein [Acidobacteriota bacterium]PYU61495.1 MAG: mitomycin resistance protein [Acidobacteriota bacterium]PYU72422.1 MAG: mitomycin resistance protein [Acidobacteriota bacterium]
MLRDFELLGIRSVAQLARQNPQRLYARLNRIQAQRQDPCVLDVFSAAVAQAQNPRLPAAQCQWWYWSKKRKQ